MNVNKYFCWLFLFFCSCSEERDIEKYIISSFPIKIRSSDQGGEYVNNGEWKQKFILQERLNAEAVIRKKFEDNGFVVKFSEQNIEGNNQKGLRFIIPKFNQEQDASVLVWYFSDQI